MQTLTEKEAEDFLEKEGFNVIKRSHVKTKTELKKLEKKLKYPWVMKISSKHIVHKAKIGGTILNINSLEEAENALAKLCLIEKCEGALVQEMAVGEELIIGIKKTPEFSQVIMLGKGGSNVEKEKDISFRIPPIKSKDAEEMINELQYSKILAEKNVNRKLIIQNLLKISELAQKYTNIEEMDINPLIVNKNEAIVVDARIVFD